MACLGRSLDALEQPEQLEPAMEPPRLVGALRDHHALDVKQDVHDRYNEAIDAENLRMAWGVSTVSSWYKSESGRVAQNWPFPLLDFWQRTREVDPSDYEVV